MNLMDLLLNDARQTGALTQLSRQFGLGEQQTQSAISALLPALAGALRQNNSQPGGLEALLGALQSGNHHRYLEDPTLLASPGTVADGNGILAHLFGSKEVSRQVASRASAETGIGADILKQMLPVVAGLVMGELSKQTARGASAAAPQSSGGIFGMVTSLLDQNRDGSALDDVLGMAARFLRSR
jgi:hypothetical protein